MLAYRGAFKYLLKHICILLHYVSVRVSLETLLRSLVHCELVFWYNFSLASLSDL